MNKDQKEDEYGVDILPDVITYVVKVVQRGMLKDAYIKNKRGYLTSKWKDVKGFKSKKKALKALAKTEKLSHDHGDSFESAKIDEYITTIEDEPKRYVVRLEKIGTKMYSYLCSGKGRPSQLLCDAKRFKSENKATKSLEEYRIVCDYPFPDAQVLEYITPDEITEDKPIPKDLRIRVEDRLPDKHEKELLLWSSDSFEEVRFAYFDTSRNSFYDDEHRCLGITWSYWLYVDDLKAILGVE